MAYAPNNLTCGLRELLVDTIIPSTELDQLMAPNFFLEVEESDGTQAVAARQACYDGALGARAMYSLQTCGQDEPVYDNKSYTLSSTYSATTLKMYTSHPLQPANPGDSPEYVMHMLNGWY